MSSSYLKEGDIIEHHMVVVSPMPVWLEYLSIVLLIVGVVWMVVSLVQTNFQVKAPGIQIMLGALMIYLLLWASPSFLLREGSESGAGQGIQWVIHFFKNLVIFVFAYGFYKLCQHTRRSKDA